MSALSRVTRSVALVMVVGGALASVAVEPAQVAVSQPDPQAAATEQAELERLRTDWAQLLRYRDENLRLAPPSPVRAYATQHKLVYVDYGAALADSAGGIKPALSEDGVHPSQAGYAVMKPLARQSVLQALGKH